MYTARAIVAAGPHTDVAFERPISAWCAVLLAIHAPLAVALTRYSALAALHAAVVLIVGLQWSVFGRRVDRVAYVAAYITGAEVLWRMTNDRLPWELGKYSVTLLCAIGIVRILGLKGLIWPALVFALFLPSSVLTAMDFTPAEVKDQLAFNLSGPLALVVCARFFSAIRLTPNETRRTLIFIVAPVVAIATVVFYGIASTPDIVWTTESNYATSGGFGPNQVSAALGLGALAAFLCACDYRSSGWLRLICLGLVTWFSAQSILTFSRGGMYCAAGGAIVAAFYLVRNPQTRLKVLVVGVLVYVLGATVVWPRLDRFTDGAISARYQSVETTGRVEIGEDDLNLWRANPIFGVGPGRSRFSHFHGAAAHTEFTRLVSEHGLFGFISIVLMVWAAFRILRRAETARERAIVAALIAWSVLFMFSAAMRLVAPSFAFGLAFTNFLPFNGASSEAVAPSFRRRQSTDRAA